MKALTVRQPWAWAIINAGKDVENRNWHTKLRGRIAIHAAMGVAQDEYNTSCEYIQNITHAVRIPNTSIQLPLAIGKIIKNTGRELQPPAYEELVRGAIIGTVEIIDCVQKSDSLWFEGTYGFILAHPEKLSEPIPCKGALGFWSIPQDVESRIRGERPV